MSKSTLAAWLVLAMAVAVLNAARGAEPDHRIELGKRVGPEKEAFHVDPAGKGWQIAGGVKLGSTLEDRQIPSDNARLRAAKPVVKKTFRILEMTLQTRPCKQPCEMLLHPTAQTLDFAPLFPI
jgi:hypothetical protein